MLKDGKKLELLVTVNTPAHLIEKIRQISPLINISYFDVKKPEDVPREVWQRAEILYTLNVYPEPEWVPNLRWIQLYVSGADYSLAFPVAHLPEVVVTTLSGSNAIMVAEYALLMMLALGLNLQEHIKRQNDKAWIPDQWNQPNLREIRGSTIGLVGYGSIGRQIAHVLTPLKVEILAAKQDLKRLKDTGFYFPDSGDPEGDLFSRLYPINALKSMVKKCDFVVVSLPLTASTRGIFGEEVFSGMKKDAYLIVVGRGGVVDEQSLYQALANGTIQGAALDVFAEEPLPDDSPLWKAPNLIITPHIAGIGPNYADDGMTLFIENLKRYINGTPLLNRVDVNRGY